MASYVIIAYIMNLIKTKAKSKERTDIPKTGKSNEEI